MFPIQFIQRMQSKIELLDRNGYLSLAKNISFLSTPREMNTWEHGWRSQVLLFHLRNYIYFFFSWIVAEEDPRWKRDQQRTGVRESLFEGSHPFFFFPQNFSFHRLLLRISIFGGRSTSAKSRVVRSLVERNSAACSNRTQWRRLDRSP